MLSSPAISLVRPEAWTTDAAALYSQIAGIGGVNIIISSVVGEEGQRDSGKTAVQDTEQGLSLIHI